MRFLLCASVFVIGCVQPNLEASQEAVLTCCCPVGYVCDVSGSCVQPPPTGCPAAANASTLQICQLNCNAGWADCDGQSVNGCETSLNTVTDCGVCHAACSTNNATPACAAGTCTIASCSAGYGDCNNLPNDGCETNLANSTANCGACGNDCGANATCQGGACVSSAYCGDGICQIGPCF